MTRYSFTLIDPWRSGKTTFRIIWDFPTGSRDRPLLERGRQQVERYGVEIVEDEIQALAKEGDVFHLTGLTQAYRTVRVLLATGLTHLPPEIAGVRECLGLSLFF
ncbi:MAG: hypothetical protein ABW047_05615 [Nitrospiraceae bacterium]